MIRFLTVTKKNFSSKFEIADIFLGRPDWLTTDFPKNSKKQVL